MMILRFIQFLTITCGAIVFFLCLILVFSKSAFEKLSEFCNKSFSTRKMLKGVEISRHFDIFAVFQVRTVFTLVLICSLLSLFFIFNNFDSGRLAEVFASKNQNTKSVYQTIFQVGYSGLILSLLLTVIISLMSLFHPKSFDGISQKMNAWISTRKGYKSMDITRDIDQVLFNYRVHIGILGIVVSLVMIFSCLASL